MERPAAGSGGGEGALTGAPEKSSILRPLVEDLQARRAQISLGGGEEKIAKQHAAEKLTARERLALLIDAGTFTELGIHGRPHFAQRAMDGKEAPAEALLELFGVPDVTEDEADFFVSNVTADAWALEHREGTEP